MKTRWVQTTEKKAFADCRPGKAAGKSATELCVTGAEAQTLRGFGACFNEMGWESLQRLSASDRAKVMKLLFHKSACAFSYNRLPIGANDYSVNWYSHNENDGDYEMKHFSLARDRQRLVPYIKAALEYQPDMTLFASPWCPPAWLKTSKVYNCGTLTWDKRTRDAYALYFAKFVEAYAQEGIRIAQVHVQNEPNSNQKFPSCLWTGEKMRDFIRDNLGPLFAKRKLDCEIWAGTLEKGTEHGWEYELIGTMDYARWAHTILSDAKARSYISGVGYQWDGKTQVQRTHAAWPDMPIVQTESECGDGKNTWIYAHYTFNLIWHYLNNGACAYVYWNMILPEGGESTWGWAQNSLLTVTGKNQLRFSPEFHVMRHFAQFVKPGAKRLELSGMMAAYALAFRNPDGSVAVVVSNPLEREEPVLLNHAGQQAALKLAPRSFSTVIFQA